MNKFLPIEGFSGVWTRSSQIFPDDRGYFSEEVRKSSLPVEVPEFVQDSISFSKKHVLRGMHLQHDQWQLVTLLRGEVIDVVFNLDAASVEYKEFTAISLTWNATNQVLISPGIAHGYAVLSQDALIHYKSSIYYGDSLQIGVNWQSKEIINCWPNENWIISQRDLDFMFA